MARALGQGVEMDVFMRDSDAFSWYMEHDPILRSTVVAVAWLERSPDWDVFVAKVDQATRLIPVFRQRVIEPPARLATPRWTVDDEFDLTWHLRRIDSPEPHMPETVVAFARLAAMTRSTAPGPCGNSRWSSTSRATGPLW